MGARVWGEELAAAYDVTSADMFDPAVLGPTLDLLAELAGHGPALELAIGTGRVGLALSERGIPVSGIELSPHMAAQLRAKAGADRIAVTMGDMTSTRAPGTFTLVYLVFNTIMNVTTQEEQLSIFANAADHLQPGGYFVVEVVVPQPRTRLHGDLGRVFAREPAHVAIDTYDDPVGQISSSHHWMAVDGRLVYDSAPFRYVWPSELDLMGRLAGFRLEHRWADWSRSPLTADSTSQVAVFEKVDHA